MQFKVGDMVVLKDGLEVGEKYGGIHLWPHMKNDFEKPCKIDGVVRLSNKECDYYYRLESLSCYYSHSMLSLYQPKEQSMPRFSIRKLDEGFAFGVWLYFKPFSMHITFARLVFNFRVVK